MKVTQPFSGRAKRKTLDPDVGQDFYAQAIMLF